MGHIVAARQCSPASLLLVSVRPEEDVIAIVKDETERSRHGVRIQVKVCIQPRRGTRCTGSSTAHNVVLVNDGRDFAKIDREDRLLRYRIARDKVSADYLELSTARNLEINGSAQVAERLSCSRTHVRITPFLSKQPLMVLVLMPRMVSHPPKTFVDTLR